MRRLQNSRSQQIPRFLSAPSGFRLSSWEPVDRRAVVQPAWSGSRVNHARRSIVKTGSSPGDDAALQRADGCPAARGGSKGGSMRPLGQFENYLVHEFVEDYEDGLMTRRDMIRRVLHITGGVAATATILTQLGVTPLSRLAAAQEATPAAPSGPRSPISVAADDPRIVGEDITFQGSDATIMAYQARPSGTGGTPAASPAAGAATPLVLICHENRGLTEHI